jgi:hypothetical protein
MCLLLSGTAVVMCLLNIYTVVFQNSQNIRTYFHEWWGTTQTVSRPSISPQPFTISSNSIRAIKELTKIPWAQIHTNPTVWILYHMPSINATDGLEFCVMGYAVFLIPYKQQSVATFFSKIKVSSDGRPFTPLRAARSTRPPNLANPVRCRLWVDGYPGHLIHLIHVWEAKPAKKGGINEGIWSVSSYRNIVFDKIRHHFEEIARRDICLRLVFNLLLLN